MSEVAILMNQETFEATFGGEAGAHNTSMFDGVPLVIDKTIPPGTWLPLKKYKIYQHKPIRIKPKPELYLEPIAPIETWKDVRDYEGRYKVSDQGRVMTLNYRNTGKIGLLACSLAGNGYRYIQLFNEKGESKTLRVGNVVAAHFVKGIKKAYVDHKNEIKSDDRADNLQYLSARANTVKSVSKNKKTGLPVGVGRVKNRFRARIRAHGQQYYLGVYKTPYEAHKAYLKARDDIEIGIYFIKKVVKRIEERHQGLKIGERVSNVAICPMCINGRVRYTVRQNNTCVLKCNTQGCIDAKKAKVDIRRRK